MKKEQNSEERTKETISEIIIKTKRNPAKTQLTVSYFILFALCESNVKLEHYDWRGSTQENSVSLWD